MNCDGQGPTAVIFTEFLKAELILLVQQNSPQPNTYVENNQHTTEYDANVTIL